MINEDDDRPARSGSGLTVLLRLWPYARPFRSPLLFAGIAVLGAMFAGLTIPLIVGRIVDGPVASGDASGLVLPVLGVLGLGLLEAGMFLARRRLVARPVTRIEAGLRTDLYAHLQRLPVSFHDRWPSGQLLSRAVADLTTVRRFLSFVLIYLVVNCLTVLTGIVVLFTLSPILGLIVTATNLPMIVFSVVFEKRYSSAARRAQDLAGDLTTTVEESVQGIRVLKAFGRGRDIRRTFAANVGTLRGAELRKFRLLAALWAVIVLLSEVAVAGLLVAGTLGVANGSLSLGTMIAGVTVCTFLLWPTAEIGWLLTETSNTISACRRYWEVRDAQVTITDPNESSTLAEPVRGHLVFTDVRFRYPGAEQDLLTGVDLDLRPGETLALVGATGSGKTTLTALVPRLYDVTGGSVTLDGVDVRELGLGELRTTVATAFSEPVLFSAAVTENVTMGTREHDEADVRRALSVAKATEFVDELPWGAETRIGEQGLSLSGGQRQRLALARAVAAKPAVLVLDDPLSALDVHTEAEVERALRTVLHGVTALLVAHRASTVLLADRVALLSGGRITAIGEHSELLATNAEYRHLLSTMDTNETLTEVSV